MTTTALNTKNTFNTNGVTVDFPFTFAVAETENVYALTEVGGVETPYENFSVTLATSAEGGNFHTNDVLDDCVLVVYRSTVKDQEAKFTNGGKFPAQTVEESLDKLTRQNQEQQEVLDRCLQTRMSDDQPYMVLTETEMEGYEGAAKNTEEFAWSLDDKYQPYDGSPEKLTATGIANSVDSKAEIQREQISSSFDAQFFYAFQGNISDYAGQQLTEDQKLWSFAYPDDTDNWYAAVQSQDFPVAIPEDPTAEEGLWGLVRASNDYVCIADFPGSHSEKLQLAVNSGKRVCIPKSTNWIVSNVDLTGRDLMLFGGGALQLTASQEDSIQPMFIGDANSIYIDDIIFTGDRFNQSIAGVRTDNYDWLRRRSIYNGTCNDLAVSNCDISEFFTIQFSGMGDKWVFLKNNFHDNDKDAVAPGWDSDTKDGTFKCTEFVFQHNNIERLGYKESAADTREYATDIPSVTGNGLLINNCQKSVVTNNTGADIDRNFAKWQGMRQQAIACNNVVSNSSLTTNCDFAMFAFAIYGGADVDETCDIIAHNTAINWHAMFHLNSSVQCIGSVIGPNICTGTTDGASRNGIYGIKKCADVQLNPGYAYIKNNNQCALRLVGVDGDIDNIRITGGYLGADNYAIEHTLSGGIGAINGIKFRGVDVESKVRGNAIKFDTDGVVNDLQCMAGSTFTVIDDDSINVFQDVNADNHVGWRVSDCAFSKWVFISAAATIARDNVVEKADSTGRTVILNQDAPPSESGHYAVRASGSLHVFDGDAEPDVTAMECAKVNDTAANNIIGFAGGYESQIVSIVFRSGNTTLIEGSQLRLKGGVDYTPRSPEAMSFICEGSDIWIEI